MSKKYPFAWLLVLGTAGLAVGCMPRGPHPLLAAPAPEVTLQTMDGQPQTLRERGAGAKVHLVEFWASWCGPCRYTMPMIQDLAKEFKDQGVVVTAVNEGETAETVSEYLKGKPMLSHVVLDLDGAAGAAFKVTGIPFTVLLDARGVIQASYTGYSSSLHGEIRADIQKLLRGESLIEVKPATVG